MKIGKYETTERLGIGSMGIVYRARDTDLEREVALKTIRTGSEVEPELRERFYREARACARLQHPSIVSVFDLGEADGTAFIAMELLLGSDLRKLIENRTPIDLPTKIEAMIQICEALAHAHRHGIIHRDVKPSNLFLTNEKLAKVLDFGIARLPSSRLTVAGKILGTPNYMAPEQILAEPTDPRSDLFSAAVVFFELLVYRHPFQAQVIPRRIVEGEPDSLMDYDPSLPPLLTKIFARALARVPENRYRSGTEFASDLRTLLDALRQNASPTFSRVELPSDRARPETIPSAPPADLTLLTPVPEGEDPYEWRLSEVLRLIPQFEDAIERKDTGEAASVLAHLEAIQTVDSRFADAVQLCQVRLTEAGAAPPGPPVPPSEQATIVDLGSAAVFDKPRKPPSSPPPPRVSPLRLKVTADWRLVAAGFAIAAAVILFAVYMWLQRPVPVERFVATAVVKADGTSVYRDQSTSSRLMTAVQGEVMNVLTQPQSGDEWVRVQRTRPKAARPGFMRVADLDQWDSSDPATLWAMIRVFWPGQPEKLRSFIALFPGTPQACLAHVELAGPEFARLQQMKNQVRTPQDPVPNYDEQIKVVRDHLDAAGCDAPMTAGMRGKLDQFVAELAPPVKTAGPVIPPPPLTPAQQVKQYLVQAEQLRQKEQYTRALENVDKALKIQKDNEEALRLRDRLKEAIELAK